MRPYLRYFGTHLLIAFCGMGLLIGGGGYWLGLATGVVFWIVGDVLSAEIAPMPERYARRWLLDVALYSLLLPLVVLSVLFAWALSVDDLLGIGGVVAQISGYDALAARQAAGATDILGASLSFALAIAMGGILTAHELVHRTRDRCAMWCGRWMLAMAFNATLEVAHVFGHHRDVGTPADPTTAYRGESVYHFYLRSTVGQVFQAWRIEKERLAACGRRPWSAANRVIRGFIRSFTVAALFYVAGGAFALGVFLFASAWNKLLLEALNYMEHYGLVRVPGTPIEPRHSWDSLSAFSHAALFNLPWHADHHHRPGVQFPELRPSADSPKLGAGYLATLPLVLVPPLWRRVIAPRLAAWDRELATDAERALVALPGQAAGARAAA